MHEGRQGIRDRRYFLLNCLKAFVTELAGHRNLGQSLNRIVLVSYF